MSFISFTGLDGTHRRRHSLLWMLLLGAVARWAAPAHAAGLDTQIEALLRNTDLRGTTVAVAVKDVDRAELIASFQADLPMIPASNMKLVTASAALSVLGPDFVFRTEMSLLAGGPNQPATLLVRGDGDPALGDPKLLAAQGIGVEELLQAFVAPVLKQQITEVERLIIDERVFDRELVHPTWPEGQLNQWYCAQVAGLNFHDNCLDIYPRPTYPGEAPRLTLSPLVPFLKLINRAQTGNSDTFGVTRDLGTNEMTFRGTVKNTRVAPVSVTIHDPPIFFGQLLANRLAAAGIKVNAIERPALEDHLPAGAPLLVVQTPLAQVLARCNKDSQNLFAEALIKRMGRQATGAPGGWTNGAAAIRQFLHDRLGARSAAVNIADGSGMSRDNQITARVMVELLASMYRDPRLGPELIESLSVGGEDGTLQRRYRAGLHGTVYGKSGYLNGVSCLSGFLLLPGPDADAKPAGADAAATTTAPAPQRVLAFSLLFNGFKPPLYNHHMKAVQDRIIDLVDEQASRLTPAGANLGG